MADYSFDYPNTDDGTRGIPAYLAQAMQFYGTPNNSPLPSDLSYPLNNQPGQNMFGGGGQFQVPPMDQAMAPPQTPVSQAMAPQQPNQYNTPLAPKAPPQAAWRDKNNPLWDGLLAGGAAMGGAKDFTSGFTAAGQAIGKGIDDSTDRQRALNAPKVTPLADGAFTLLQFPDGTQKTVKNADVAQYLTQSKADAATLALQKLGYQANLADRGAQNKEDRAAAEKAQAGIDSVDASIKKLNDLAGPVAAHGRLAQAQALPVVGSIASAFGSKDAVNNQQINDSLVSDVLAAGQQLKGSESDRDMNFLKSSKPSATDSKEVIEAWRQRALEAAQNIRQKLVDQQARGQTQAPSATAMGGARPLSSVQNADAVSAEMRRRGFLK